jgi:hypothetical protein
VEMKSNAACLLAKMIIGIFLLIVTLFKPLILDTTSWCREGFKNDIIYIFLEFIDNKK